MHVVTRSTRLRSVSWCDTHTSSFGTIPISFKCLCTLDFDILSICNISRTDKLFVLFTKLRILSSSVSTGRPARDSSSRLKFFFRNRSEPIKHLSHKRHKYCLLHLLPYFLFETYTAWDDENGHAFRSLFYRVLNIKFVWFHDPWLSNAFCGLNWSIEDLSANTLYRSIFMKRNAISINMSRYELMGRPNSSDFGKDRRNSRIRIDKFFDGRKE